MADIFLGPPPYVKEWILKKPLCFTTEQASSTVDLNGGYYYPELHPECKASSGLTSMIVIYGVRNIEPGAFKEA